MKICIFLFFFSFVILTFSCTGKEKKKMVPNTVVKVSPKIIELGEIKQSAPSSGLFTIYNIGKHMLIIQDVPTTCHCTVVSFNKKPIKPGDSTKIKIEYDNSILGYFQKSALVYANAEGAPFVLTIRGEVLE